MACTSGPKANSGEFDLSGRVSYLVDPTSKLDLKAAYQQFKDGVATQSPTATHDFGLTDSTVWLVVTAPPKGTDPRDNLVLDITNGRLAHVSVFTLDHQGAITSEFHQHRHTPIDERTEYSRAHSFPIPTELAFDLILIRVQSDFRMQIPIQLETRTTHDTNQLTELLTFGLYFGIALIMASYNLLIFLISRQRVYLLYFYAVFSFALLMSIVRGFGYFILPDSLLPLLGHIGLLGSLWPGAFLCLFVNQFLDLKTKHFPSFLVVRTILALIVLVTALYPWLSVTDRSNSIFRLAAFLAASLMAITIHQLRAGQRAARFLFWAWLGFLSGILIFISNKLGFLPRNAYTQNGLLFGSAVEMTVLSLALPVQLRQLRREQQTVYRQLEQVNDELEIETAERQSLNARVTKLEVQVTQAKSDLQAAHHELDSSEAQLIQAEKMASVGQLVATVTHDIANPTTHIMVAQATLHEKLEWLLTKEGRLLLKDKPITTVGEMLQQSSLIGLRAKHIADIHRTFANYTRPDTEKRDRVDVHELLEDTMLIMKTRVHPHTLEASLMQVHPTTCRPSEICQAVTNLVANAADALSNIGTSIAPAAAGEPGKIKLSLTSTQRAGHDGMLITVEDNGPGLPPVDEADLLKPFFTTKNPGEGTGLGLAITQRIIARHNGSLQLGQSDTLSGAKAEIWLPFTPLVSPELVR